MIHSVNYHIITKCIDFFNLEAKLRTLTNMKTIQIFAILTFCSIFNCQTDQKAISGGDKSPEQIELAKFEKALYFFMLYAHQLDKISNFSEKDKDLKIITFLQIHDELLSHFGKKNKLKDRMIQVLLKMLGHSMKKLTQIKQVKTQPLKWGKK